MDLLKISEALSTSHLRTYRDDDLWIDRLSHRYSVVIFSVFAVLVTTKAYIGDPIDCWAPPEFKASYERYAETLCFVNGTYYISANEIEIPTEDNKRYSNRVRYYQWTPFVLLLQAFCMYLPRVIWLTLNTRYGINLRNLVDAAKKYESVDSYSNKEKILVYICRNLLRTVQYTEYLKNNDRLLDLKQQTKVSTNTTSTFLQKYHNKNKKYMDSRIKLNQMISSMLENLTNGTPVPSILNIKELEEYLNKNVYGDEDDYEDPKHHKSKMNKKVNFKHQNEYNTSEEPYYDEENADNNTNENFVDHHHHQQQRSSRSHHRSNNQNYNNNNSTNESRSTSRNDKNEINNNHRRKSKTKNSSGSNSVKNNNNNNNNKLPLSLPESSIFDKASPFNFLSSGSTSIPASNSFKLTHNYLSILYIFIKFLYLLISIGQVFFLNRLIGNRFYMIGVTLLYSFFYEIEWPHLDIFPRMTLCEIYIREVGTVHPYVIQCVLRINLFNEIIFVLVWYWLIFIIALTTIDLVWCIFSFLIRCSSCYRKVFALKYLELIQYNTKNYILKKESNKSNSNDKNYYSSDDNNNHNNENSNNKEEEVNNNNNEDKHPKKSTLVLAAVTDEQEYELFEVFCASNFNDDTIFALKVIEQNASSLIVSEIIQHLWLQFKSLNFIFSVDLNNNCKYNADSKTKIRLKHKNKNKNDKKNKNRSNSRGSSSIKI